MRVAVKKYFDFEKNKGKNTMKIKKDLLTAKKEGHLFFLSDLSSLEQQEEFDIYYSGLSGRGEDKDAFPIPAEQYVTEECEERRFQLFKRHYESYYPGTEMTKDLYETFDARPFEAKKCVWVTKR